MRWVGAPKASGTEYPQKAFQKLPCLLGWCGHSQWDMSYSTCLVPAPLPKSFVEFFFPPDWCMMRAERSEAPFIYSFISREKKRQKDWGPFQELLYCKVIIFSFVCVGEGREKPWNVSSGKPLIEFMLIWWFRRLLAEALHIFRQQKFSSSSSCSLALFGL